MEKLLNIASFENLYTINKQGEIKRVETQRVLKHHTSHHGYKYVNLTKNGKSKNYYVHRLIAMEFINNPYNKPFINHKNGIKDDNRIENIEWCTTSENEKHSYDMLGKTVANRQLNESDAKEIRVKYKCGEKTAELAKYYNVSSSVIWNILAGKSYKCHIPINEGNKGHRNAMAKIKEKDIKLIKSMRLNGDTYSKIASTFKVSCQTISRICNNKTFKNVK